jgi:hypothetical protein
MVTSLKSLRLEEVEVAPDAEQTQLDAVIKMPLKNGANGVYL